MLKAIIAKLEDVEEQYRGLYKELSDGTFELQVDDVPALSKLKEFRGNNVNLLKERDTERKAREELEAKYAGIDVTKYKAGIQLFKQIEDDKERKLMEEGNYEEAFKMRTTRMSEAHQADIAAKNAALEEVESDRANLRRSLGSMRIEQELGKAINETGVKIRKGAMPDVMSRTHGTFQVADDGSIQPLVNGSVVRGAKGEPLTMTEHIQVLASNAGHLFESGGGGGAGGSDGGGPNNRTSGGKILVDPNDPRAASKYHKELRDGTAVYADDAEAGLIQ